MLRHRCDARTYRVKHDELRVVVARVERGEQQELWRTRQFEHLSRWGTSTYRERVHRAGLDDDKDDGPQLLRACKLGHLAVHIPDVPRDETCGIRVGAMTTALRKRAPRCIDELAYRWRICW